MTRGHEKDDERRQLKCACAKVRGTRTEARCALLCFLRNYLDVFTR